TFLLLIIVMNGTIYYSFSQMMLKNELERAVDDADKTVRGMQTGLNPNAILSAFMPTNGMIRIVNENGEVNSTSTSPTQQDLRKLSGKYFDTDMEQIIKGANEKYTLVSYPIVLPSGEIANLQMMESLSKTEHTIKTLRLILIIITLIALIP